MKINKKKYLYLISPNIINISFYNDLIKVLKSKKVSFFQLRLKKDSLKNKIKIGKKIKIICQKYQVKFIINDDPLLAKIINADGCHLGQKDMNIYNARKLLKKKIIGITCHNSLRLAKLAIKNKADYVAFGAFNSSKTKKVKYKANISLIKKLKKLSNIPVVAIGGINNLNYKKLLLNKADFFAISIALKSYDEIVSGLIFDPIKNEMFFAEKENGSYFNNQRIKVSKKSELNDCLFVTGGKIKQEPDFSYRKSGCAALDMAYVAAGRYDGYFQNNLNLWDIAAGIVLVKEAGGVINEIDLSINKNIKIIASSSSINSKLLKKLNNF